MIDIEEKLCQRIAKEFGLDAKEVMRIQRSQFRQAYKTIKSFEGKCFALPYIGEFSVLPNKERYLEVCRYNRDNNIEFKKNKVE